MLRKTLFLLVLFLSIILCTCTIYRGGTISWTAQANGTVKFRYRLGFQYGANGCNASNIGNYVTSLSSEYWYCTNGCNVSTLVTDNSYYCAGFDVIGDWEYGEKVFIFSSTEKSFTVGYSGGPYMALGYGSSGNWSIETTVDLRNRSDTAVPNNSPITAALPVYRLQYGCSETVSIPVYDIDNDVINCRWAQGSECGGICNGITRSLPSGTINPTLCTLTVNPTIANGYAIGETYFVAMVIEDKPRSTILLEGQTVSPTQALSGTPLQFLVYIDNSTSTCSEVPQIIDTPPSGSEYIVPIGYTWTQKIYVQTSGSNTPENLVMSVPRGVQQTTFLADDKGRMSTFYTEVSYRALSDNTGVTPVCFSVRDNKGLYSEQRCFRLLVGYPDPCASNPCQNRGTCLIQFTNYTCQCPSGVYGEHCEHDIDECKQDPCENNALCQNYIGDYKCFCRQGYAGKNCTDGEFCSSNPCQGRGICIHNVTTFSCDCFHGYSGPTCQSNADDCQSSPCKNGGKCQDLVGDYLCTCPPDFTGKDCEIAVDYCNPSPCQNGGVCSYHPAGYVCDCPDDVIGLNCELPIQQACDGDQSYCLCKINGEPVHVSIPDTFIDDEKERYLTSGIIGYPVGLVFGACMCALFHYFIRPRCLKKGNKRPGSASSSESGSATSRSTLPPTYSSLGFNPSNSNA